MEKAIDIVRILVTGPGIGQGKCIEYELPVSGCIKVECLLPPIYIFRVTLLPVNLLLDSFDRLVATGNSTLYPGFNRSRSITDNHHIPFYRLFYRSVHGIVKTCLFHKTGMAEPGGKVGTLHEILDNFI